VAKSVETELQEAVERIVRSPSPKKLVVAGPGTGKTTLFKKLLSQGIVDPKRRLILTFINNLKTDLERSLGALARVYTLHGYCQSLLRRYEPLRHGLTADFVCLPGLASLIKKDWEWLKENTPPHFVEMMRQLNFSSDLEKFYFDSAEYYDAVDFDDSVYRICRRLVGKPHLCEKFDLVLIDEFQDFNKMEAGLIELLGTKSPILIAGDDDQALYGQLRGASWDYIRSLHASGNYEVFELPFCMRCPEVIVEAVNDVIRQARVQKKLNGRIEKPYRHYEPKKGADSKQYPKIDLVTTSVQRNNANYFGKYIEKYIGRIKKEELAEARKNNEPAMLVIGPKPYRPQIVQYLTKQGIIIETASDQETGPNREQGLAFLADDPRSNLGWRIVLAFENEEFAAKCIRRAFDEKSELYEAIPEKIKNRILKEAEAFVSQTSAAEVATAKTAEAEPRIKLTSYEGAKGLSAQHVFLVGLHAGDLPRDPQQISDVEICRFVVGLTRTRKKCTLMLTRRFGDQVRDESPFVTWIKSERYKKIYVDAQYWK
jgi:superfamily I DNA/RNA helicase